MADAIRDVKETVTYCRICYNFAEGELCSICADPARDGSKICIVEQVRDLYAIEKSGAHNGTYHVLLGAWAPLDGIEPEDLTLEPLLERVRAGGISEVIIATDTRYEGEGTALYLRESFSEFEGLRVTRIAATREHLPISEGHWKRSGGPLERFPRPCDTKGFPVGPAWRHPYRRDGETCYGIS